MTDKFYITRGKKLVQMVNNQTLFQEKENYARNNTGKVILNYLILLQNFCNFCKFL